MNPFMFKFEVNQWTVKVIIKEGQFPFFKSL